MLLPAVVSCLIVQVDYGSFIHLISKRLCFLALEGVMECLLFSQNMAKQKVGLLTVWTVFICFCFFSGTVSALFKSTNLTDQSDKVSVWKKKKKIVFNPLIYSWGYREHSKSMGSVLWTFIVCKWVPSIQFIFGNGLNDAPFWYYPSPINSVSYFY